VEFGSMNVLLCSIDSLRWDVLGAYRDEPAGFGYPVETPNLDRFADRAIVFETHYAGSLPCMPARREWLTGTQEFLWRSWGPVEPFDHPLPRAARHAGVLTGFVSDHYHYFQHGSNGYYQDFNGWELIRGHEWDAFRTTPREPPDEEFRSQLGAGEPDDLDLLNRIVYARNTVDLEDEADYFAPRVFTRTADWLSHNREWDRWFCYVDSFDVHEPFDVPEPYASMYTDEDPTDPDLPVWPFYGRIDAAGDTGQSALGGDASLTERQLDFVRAQFAGKTTMVDTWFGRVLDTLDEEGLWDDTAVIVTSDHGHFLGDHGWMGKPYAPMYDVLARTPLVIWHPDSPRAGESVEALTSAVDVYATVLDLLGVETPDGAGPHSRSLVPLLEGATDAHRDWALYGYWGSSVNVTDGTYTYLHPCDADRPAETYSTTMMNPYPRQFRDPEPKRDAEPAGLPYTDTPVWRFETPAHSRQDDPMLFDVSADPDQLNDLVGDSSEEERMRGLLVTGLDALEAPEEQYRRLGLS
jgi:arylsulfatase A-like enzyme